MPEVEIGQVSDFFAHPVVAGIELIGKVNTGDRIHIKGHTTDMEIAAVVNKVGYDYFRWRFSLSIPWKLVLVLGMTVLTALLAQIRLPLPFSPVPVTGQTSGY
jgi:hypothetical protein